MLDFISCLIGFIVGCIFGGALVFKNRRLMGAPIKTDITIADVRQVLQEMEYPVRDEETGELLGIGRHSGPNPPRGGRE